MKKYFLILFFFTLNSIAFTEVINPDLEKLQKFAVEIATNANPQFAKEFLRDTIFTEKAMNLNENLTQKLISYSEALSDLEKIIDQPLEINQHNQISAELSVRMDINRPLCEINICPEPEKLIVWIGKYKKNYSKEKLNVLEKSIRKWEIVFGTIAVQKVIEWDQARAINAVTVKKEDWVKMVLRERNAILFKLAANAARGKDDSKFKEYDAAIGKFLDQRDITIEAAKILINSGSLTPQQLAQLDNKPFDQQVYLLGKFFDGVEVKPELKPYIDRINSQRTSTPQESLNYQQREMLSKMLSTSFLNEIKGTKAGDKIISFYKNKTPEISVEYCNNCYSKYENGKIIIDAATIEQYMKVRGYKAENLFKDKNAVDDIAKYMSPAFVKSAGLGMIDSYFKSKGLYNPPVQEQYISASALEGLYTSEKIKKDAKFKSIFTEMSPNSDYASKVMITQREMANSGLKQFSNRIGMLYYSNLPSTASAKSQILMAISNELERREKMSESQRKEVESLAILTLEEVLNMSVEEFVGSVGDIKKEILLKIRSDMSSGGNNYYGNFMSGIRKDYNSLSASAVPKEKVPMPGVSL